ncbi:unnamed protein product [Penicillium glandicola]
MKASTILGLFVAYAATASAIPVKQRDDQVEITFIGAADAQFTQSIPNDGSTVSIENPLSISHISSNTAGVQCTFNGIDNSVTIVDGAQLVDVGPPQTQVSASCQGSGSSSTPPSTPPRDHSDGDEVYVTFLGAADAQFTQSFPSNGEWVEIVNPLSISHIQTSSEGVTCVFNGVDHSVTTVIGTQLVDVGPPQTQVSGSCLVGYAFAGIDHAAHGHRHFIPRIKDLEPRNLAWDNVNVTPDDVVMEIITLTTTTTVYGKCAPTNTMHSTLTLVKHKPEPTQCGLNHHVHSLPAPEPYQDQWNQHEPQPEPVVTAPTNTRPAQPKFTQPRPEETTTMLKTETITKTATNTVMVTVYPGANHVPTTNTFPGNPSKTEEALADTLPKGTLEEKQAVPAKVPHQRPHNNHGGPIKAVIGVPGEIIPDLPVVNQIFPGQKPWTATPPNGKFSRRRFGGRTLPTGTEIHYRGNVGIPWGSNIIAVSATEAYAYKYVVQFTGSNDEPWMVVVWNKVGPDDKMTGWYGNSALTFTLAPGETRYVAFDEDSEGAWAAAPGDHLPTDQAGGYSSTWGEFTFGDGENQGWSGWDVSAIQAQIANQHVQGMSICQADGKKCSIITPDAEKVVDAYTESKKHLNGIGGSTGPGPVRLNVVLDYQG